MQGIIEIGWLLTGQGGDHDGDEHFRWAYRVASKVLIDGGSCLRIIRHCDLIKPHQCGLYSCISLKKKKIFKVRWAKM